MTLQEVTSVTFLVGAVVALIITKVRAVRAVDDEGPVEAIRRNFVGLGAVTGMVIAAGIVLYLPLPS